VEHDHDGLVVVRVASASDRVRIEAGDGVVLPAVCGNMRRLVAILFSVGRRFRLIKVNKLPHLFPSLGGVGGGLFEEAAEARKGTARRRPTNVIEDFIFLRGKC
jgi:hypothetical protein